MLRLYASPLRVGEWMDPGVLDAATAVRVCRERRGGATPSAPSTGYRACA